MKIRNKKSLILANKNIVQLSHSVLVKVFSGYPFRFYEIYRKPKLLFDSSVKAFALHITDSPTL